MAVGLKGEQYADPVAFGDAYGKALLICAALLAVGGVLSWLTITHGAIAPTDPSGLPASN